MLSVADEFQKLLPTPEVVIIGLLAAILVFVPALWEIADHAETVVHESAHVPAGILTGRRLLSVKIETSGGGVTNVVPKSGAGHGVATFVDYVDASAGGLVAAGLTSMRLAVFPEAQAAVIKALDLCQRKGNLPGTREPLGYLTRCA
jgi:hypothetical protein